MAGDLHEHHGSRSNNTINPTVGVGLGADFVRILAHRR
jgi:hypothetical protein